MRRFLGAIALSLTACGSSEAPLPPVLPSALPSRWSAFDAARTWPEAGSAFDSRGHGGGRVVETVRVTPAALSAYRGLVPGGTLPDGTSIAAFHRSPAGSPGSVFAMEKQGGAWVFTAADPDGTLLDGATHLCARCHDEAPADHVFGVPRERARE